MPTLLVKMEELAEPTWRTLSHLDKEQQECALPVVLQTLEPAHRVRIGKSKSGLPVHGGFLTSNIAVRCAGIP